MLNFDDVGCDYGNRVRITCKDGVAFTGWFVDFEIDYDGSYGGDSVSLRFDSKAYMSFPEADIAKMEPLTQRKCYAKVKYIGEHNKVAYRKGCVYELLEITEEGLYKVYSTAFEEWALLPPQDFEIVWERGCLE